MNIISTPASELRQGQTFDLFKSFCTITSIRESLGVMLVRFVIENEERPGRNTMVVPLNFEFNIHSI